MKAQIESSGSNAYLGAVRSGKVQKVVNKQKKEENAEEIKAYLSKLQEIVPVMPKNKKLSKFEVISHVIDYIRDLRETLGLPNNQEEYNDMEDTVITETCSQTTTTVTLTVINGGSVLPTSTPSLNIRQPLSVISSNPDTEACSNSEILEQ